jgi:toxin ParE1/3/4
VGGTRELVVGPTPWVVVYRWRGEAVEVLRVLHGRQRWPG